MSNHPLHTNSALTARSAAWSRYWEHGLPHSLPGTLDMESDEPVVAFWRDVFRQLPPGGTLLDIGTGNGALPRLAIAATGAKGRLRATGIDIATINCGSVADLGGAVTLLSNVNAENLPHQDAEFDAVVSQFGLEYTELARSVPEVARVLVDNGRVALLMHDPASLLVQVATEEAQHAGWLLDANGLLELVGDVARPSCHGPALANAAAAIIGALEHRIRTSPRPALLLEAHRTALEIMRLCATGRSLDGQTLARLYQLQVEDARIRASELVAVSLDHKRLSELTSICQAAGLHIIRTAPIHHSGGARLGTTLVGVRTGISRP